MRCCVSCFRDEYLKALIRTEGRIGKCDYCKSSNRYTVSIGEIDHLFERFLTLYEPVQVGQNVMDYFAGDPLADLIQSEWDIFSERLGDNRSRLLSHIYRVGRRNEEILDVPAVNDLWVKTNAMHHHSLMDKWEELAEELKHPERPREVIDLPPPPEGETPLEFDELDWFEEDIPRAITKLPKGSRVFRVRLDCRGEEEPFEPVPVAEMGAPPTELTESGRANEKGVRYLYVAGEEKTAVAEKRPHRGMHVTVAEGTTVCDLEIVDLAKGMGIESPFTIGEDYLRGLIESCELFNYLNDEYAKPLRRTDRKHEYVPTQHFAEWCKRHRYDGLRYTSAMSKEGTNLVFFDANAVEFTSSRLLEIEDVEVSYRRL